MGTVRCARNVRKKRARIAESENDAECASREAFLFCRFNRKRPPDVREPIRKEGALLRFFDPRKPIDSVRALCYNTTQKGV